MTRGTVQREQIYIYDTCQQCGEQNALVYERGELLLCAEDSRAYAKTHPLKPYCDRCGKQENVVRDPSHRRNEYLCMSCHADDGFLIQDSVTGRAVKKALSFE